MEYEINAMISKLKTHKGKVLGEGPKEQPLAPKPLETPQKDPLIRPRTSPLSGNKGKMV